MKRKSYEKAYFIDIFLSRLSDEDTVVVIIDESGFGTNPLKKYGYSPIGQPVSYHWKKLRHNLTLNSAISLNGLEAAQFMYNCGSTTETFAAYIYDLTEGLKTKYPGKSFLFVLDNLRAHKTSETVKVMQDAATEMLFIPSYTPEFSPIENWFAHLKRKVSDVAFRNHHELAQQIADIGFEINPIIAEACFRRSLNEMLGFIESNNLVDLQAHRAAAANEVNCDGE